MAPVTVDEFLQPSDDTAELYHVLATTAKSSEPREGRFSDVEQTDEWEGFDISRLSSMATMIPYLSRTCEAQLNPSIRDLTRVVFDERQLECFYLKTFVARVDTALLHAISPDEPGATIIVCPGRFDGLRNADQYEPDFILPDWIVVEGNYNPKDASSMKVEDFLKSRTILAVGDTKLIRQTKEDDQYTVADTVACHKNYLAQLQFYSKTLSTRYAFLLSNKELVVVQFEIDVPASPRSLAQRGVRSAIHPNQLHSDLPTDFNTSDPVPANESEYDESDDSMHTPPPPPAQRRRPLEATSPESPLAYRTAPSQRAQAGLSSNKRSSPLSSPPPSSSQANRSDDISTLYASSSRDADVGVARIRSFSMPDYEGERARKHAEANVVQSPLSVNHDGFHRKAKRAINQYLGLIDRLQLLQLSLATFII